MHELHRFLSVIDSTYQKSALATIIHVDGSSYRSIGSSMLFLENGIHVGLLSGGCLEQTIQDSVMTCIEMEESMIYIYNSTEEDMLNLSEGSGCRGVIHILIEPITQRKKQELLKIVQYLTESISVTYIKNLDTYDSLFITDKQKCVADQNNEILPFINNQMKNGLIHYQGDRYFLHYYQTDPRLIIFGAGDDARPLESLASQVGFKVTVTDWRPALCMKERFAETTSIIEGFPLEVMNRLHIKQSDYTIVMTHHFKYDREIIECLLNVRPIYLGVLSSKERLNRLVPDKEQYSFVYAPVGIPIKAEGPMEIAVSVMAEMVACHHDVASRKKML